MHTTMPRFRRNLLISTSALMGAAALWLATPAQAAFDPNADTTYTTPAATATATRTRLPDTRILRDDKNSRPLYAPGAATPSAGYVSPLEPIQLPRPLYPSAMATDQPVATPPSAAPAIVSAPLPALPDVDPKVAARAQEMMRAEPSAPLPPIALTTPTPSASFIAPAPVYATPAPMAVTAAAPKVSTPAPIQIATPMAPPPLAVPTPIAVPAPGTVAPVVATAAPASELSEQSRSILSNIPSKLDSTPATPTSKLALSRVSPQIQEVLGKEAQEEAYNSVGLSIKVRRPGLDTNYELNQAYTSLMGGDTQRAIEIYKNILGAEPKNEDALFGLAATYHRLGQTQQARPFYGMLLKINPNHREALNNFLTLVSVESPQDALPELERLEIRNPDFSPIPAQIAIVQDKLGYPDAAEEKMLRAIELAPDNLTYKYNLAIMLDRHKRYADASALYRLLIDASLSGDHVPATVESMQKRLNYITTASAGEPVGS